MITKKGGSYKVFYHGTSVAFEGDLDTFDAGHGIEAIYLTDSLETAENYSIMRVNDYYGGEIGARIYPVYLNSKKTKIYNNGREDTEPGGFAKNLSDLKKEGYDVVIWNDALDDQGMRIDKNGDIINIIDFGEDIIALKTSTVIVLNKNIIISIFDENIPLTKTQKKKQLKKNRNSLFS